MEIVNTPAQELIDKWGHLLAATSKIFTWTSPGELCRLAEYASKATHICEVGSYHGKSALTMALANPKSWITCIDNFENAGCELILRDNLRNVNPDQIFIIKGTTERIKNWPLFGAFPRYDFCFIDAGHLEPDVTADIAHLRPMMKPGSVMAGHDWNKDMEDGVNKGVLNHFTLDRVVIHETLWAVQL